MDEAHKLGPADRRRTSRVEETTAKDYVELGVNSIEHFYGVADAALDGVQHFPPDMNYSERGPPLRPRRRAVRAGRSRRSSSKVRRPDGRARTSRWSPTLLDLRSQPRRRPRAEPALVQGLPAPVAGGVLPGRRSTTTARTSSAGPHAGSAAGSSSTASGWTRVREFGAQGRPRSRPATMPATSTRCTASASRASSSCTRRPASTRSR